MENLNIKTTLILFLSVFFAFSSVAQKDTTEFETGKKKLIIIDKKTQKENSIYNLEKGKETFEEEIIKADELIKKHEALIKQIEKDLQLALEEDEDHIELRFDKLDKQMIEKEITEALKELEEDTIAMRDMKIKVKFKEIDPEEFKDVERDVKIIIKDLDIDDEDIVIINSDNGEFYMNGEKLLNEKELERLHAELEKHKALIELNEKKKYAFESGIREIENGIMEIEEGLMSIDDELAELDGLDEEYKEVVKKNIHKKRFNSHWAGFELGLFNFMNSSQSIANENDVTFMKLIPERSMSYGLNVLEFNIPISKYYFGIGTGAGLEWNSMSLAENINLVEVEEGVIQAEYIDVNEKNFKKNKLNAAYVKVPVLFELQIPLGQRKIHFGAGVTGSIRAWSKQKQTYIIDGRKYKDKKTDDFQLTPFRYGLTARIGYGSVGLFINYELMPLFKENKGPELYPIMVGLHIIDF